MTTSTSPATPMGAPPAAAPAGPKQRRLWASDLLLYAVLAMLVLGAWKVTRQGWFRAGDDIGYALGVAGGVAMLLLFTYPLRKYLRFMHGWGKVKWWFWAHMTLGVAGPLLILLHSTFHIGSLNAAVALYSMLVVALSGVIGRFIKLRVHRGLHGELSNLHDLRARAGFVQSDARSRLHFAPRVENRLRRFEQGELAVAPGWATTFRQVFVLPAQQSATYIVCAMELRAVLGLIGARRGWNREERSKRERQARRLVWRYLGAVVRVAQFSAYERIFALWHVAHVPFVYILVVSAIVHVVAVHAY
ncbi:hypothetical protein BURC_03239 [Burkholderiaceae bacterium]|nr:hypothetical protein BURC_03239 [Burkholderiaceae bacterium]